MSEQWRDTKPLMVKVGDVTPAGVVTEVEYFGLIGADLVIDSVTYHRGVDDFVSVRVSP
jgi:hypothetical protein